MSFNKVILIGNVGKDPDVRHRPSGGTVATFSLATSDRARDKSGNWIDQTEWHAIVCWGSNADVASSHNSTLGSLANALAMATRCFCPPES